MTYPDPYTRDYLETRERAVRRYGEDSREVRDLDDEYTAAAERDIARASNRDET